MSLLQKGQDLFKRSQAYAEKEARGGLQRGVRGSSMHARRRIPSGSDDDRARSARHPQQRSHSGRCHSCEVPGERGVERAVAAYLALSFPISSSKAAVNL